MIILLSADVILSYFLCCCSCLIVEWHKKWRSLWCFRQLYMVFITIKNIRIQLKASVWTAHMRRKIPMITLQPKRWKDCWSSPNGNLLTNQISTWPRSTNHCDVDINIVLCIPACSRRPGDSLFDKDLHAMHCKNKQIISMYEKMIEALYQEKDGWPVIGSILNCSETTEPADIKQRWTKRTCNQTASLKLKMAKPREDETGNTMNLEKDIRTFFKPIANKPKKTENFSWDGECN